MISLLRDTQASMLRMTYPGAKADDSVLKDCNAGASFKKRDQIHVTSLTGELGISNGRQSLGMDLR